MRRRAPCARTEMTDEILFDTGLAPGELDRPRPIETPWGAMALFSVGDEIFCVRAFCPHLEGPLFQGSVSGTLVTCPWHSWCFDLRTGKRVAPAGMAFVTPAATLRRCSTSLGPSGTVLLSAPEA